MFITRNIKNKDISSSSIGRSAISFEKGRSLRNYKITLRQRLRAWIWVLIVVGITFGVATPTWRVLDAYSKVVTKKGGKGVGLIDFANEGIKVVKDEPLKGEENDRINILLLGLRGEGVGNGDLLTDSIMIMSYKPSTKQVAMISIPRDLYVRVPDYNKNIYKINSVHWLGEKKEKGLGPEYMRKTVASVLNIPIHYYVRVDMAAFKESVRILGGVDVCIEKPFIENHQYGKYVFKLPAGWNHLDAEKAFNFVHSRYTTSDFDRARRQQQLIQAMKKKAEEDGILKNPGKINDILEMLSKNVKTDMAAWEIEKLRKIVETLDLDKAIKLVYDDAPGGHLYSTYYGGSYALRPVGSDFTKMQLAAKNIFEKAGTTTLTGTTTGTGTPSSTSAPTSTSTSTTTSSPVASSGTTGTRPTNKICP